MEVGRVTNTKAPSLGFSQKTELSYLLIGRAGNAIRWCA
jgi:hypothetical protein